MNNIAAVIVTYNRLSLLKRTIEAVMEQSFVVGAIIVVNNGSTDGTMEWLDQQRGLVVIHQSNLGGSGGFHIGIQYAYVKGYDWIWCMDDDVFPKENCLEELLKHDDCTTGIICPRRVQNNTNFLSEIVRMNLSNPFKNIHQQIINEKDLQNEKISIVGMTFEGPLIKREVVEKIGLPNNGFFITYDDTDYSYRCISAAYKVWYIPKAILFKEFFDSDKSREEQIRNSKWKTEYHIRNSSYFSVKYGKNFFFKSLFPLKLCIYYELAMMKNLPFNKKYELVDLKRFFVCYLDGIRGRLGKIERK